MKEQTVSKYIFPTMTMYIHRLSDITKGKSKKIQAQGKFFYLSRNLINEEAVLLDFYAMFP